MNAERSEKLVADRRFYGVAEALVSAVDDPDGEGRVRVRLPWFDPGEVSDWCRIAYMFAGNGYGSTWTPEVDDEVLVAFVHGDMRLPIVLGGLYNGQDKPPRARSARENPKALRTKAGHELLLDDSEGSLGIEVRTSAGHRVRIDDDADQIVLELSGGPSIAMSAAGGGSIEISATAITLDATSITLKATGELAASGNPIKLNS